jgi:hypothetical protein
VVNKELKIYKMKKILLFLAIGLISFQSFSQKRSKSDRSVFPNNNTSAKYEFMIIKGYSSNDLDAVATSSMNQTRVKIFFDLVGANMNESLNEMKYRSLAHAVNVVSKDGWDFISSDVIVSNGALLHFYYMKRLKK